ncbi:MAG: type II secretion system ATPase GspE [Armatimonadota bacterium]|nr:type II secretion system ATPase GspE [Armatimonadota bacterium]
MEELYKRPLGDILVRRKVITPGQLEIALEEQQRTHKKLGEVLIALEFVTEEQITEARAHQLDVGYVNLQDFQFDPEVLSLISESICRTYQLIPLKKSHNKLTVAMANPLDVEAIDLVQFETKLRVEPVLATEWRVREAIDRNYGQYEADEIKNFVQQATTDLELTSDDDDQEDIDEVRRQSHQAPIIRMVNMLLTQAVRKKASDIHIEPRRSTVDIRYRIDGELHLAKSLPKSLHPPISSRIKIMSELDISERRLPQDGRITFRLDGRNIDIRVSTSPTLYGERIVLRILDRSEGLIPLEKLGFSPRDLEVFKSLISQPYGIILVTGPTGSGKTTTLYAALNELKSEHTNIMTVEDPIEYELEGINQTNVHHRIGLTFANQLRAILRQDPDIVFVGEIRDAETADVAFRAALTGHLVFSTLHANDAPSSITRLIDMDVEPFLVSSAIIGVLAQRLVRVLCPDCKEPYEPDSQIKEMLGLKPDEKITIYRAVGCRNCDSTGYKGRTSIRETMVMTDEIRRLTINKASATEIRCAALASGMVTMRQDGANKVLAGITTIEEVQRKIFVETDLLFFGKTNLKAA